MRDSFRRCYLLPFCQGTRTPLDVEHLRTCLTRLKPFCFCFRHVLGPCPRYSDQTALYIVQRSLKPLPSSETIYHFVTAMMRFGDETPKRPWLPWLRLVSLSAESQRGVLVTVSLYKLPASDWHRILKTNVWCPLQVLGTDVQGDTSLQAIFTEPQDGSPAWTKLAFNIFQHGNLCRSMSTNVDDLNSREPTDQAPLSWAVGGVVAASALPLPRPAKGLEQFWQKGLNESPTSRPTCT